MTIGAKEAALRAMREAKAARVTKYPPRIPTGLRNAVKRMAGRPKVHASGAERQKAYRARKIADG